MSLRTACVALAASALALSVTGPASALEVAPAPAAKTALKPLPGRTVGRVSPRGAHEVLRQWPGTYFETAFDGAAAEFAVGRGDVVLRVSVDAEAPVVLVKPKPGLYRVGGLGDGPHRMRVQVISESQAGPTGFGGFFAEPGVRPLPVAARPRQIEFIGDSHTVGYGNTSPTRTCTEDQIWATTDTGQGLPGVLGARYGADYQVQAISGRGVVRNYGGFVADTLPQAYPFVLFDKQARWSDPAWRPQLVVMALGTNDFTTPLHAGEPWASRAALHADFEARYTAFVHDLRKAYPDAYFVLWATDLADGEIAAEVEAVVERLKAGGETRIAFAPVSGLAFTACNFHPSVADDRVIADTIAKAVDAQPDLWRGRPAG